jgi:fatty acid desaturase
MMSTLRLGSAQKEDVMSATVRILAIVFGTAVVAILHVVWRAPWYIAGSAGLVVFTVFPICYGSVADLRRGIRLKQIKKKAQDRKNAGMPS